MMPFERFRAWQAAYQLAVAVYRATERFPRREWYGLAAQARRAAFSVPANIAEGSAKRGAREFRRYVDIAIGSLSELSVAFKLSRDLGFLGDSDWKQLTALREEAGKLTWLLGAALSGRRRALPPSR